MTLRDALRSGRGIPEAFQAYLRSLPPVPPHCGSLHKGMVGKKTLWMTCTEPYDHAGRHYDYKRDYHWDGPAFYLGDWDDSETVAKQEQRRKKLLSIDQKWADRGEAAVEKMYETRTGQMTIHGKKHMDSDWQRDMDDIDAFFLDLYSHLYEDYYGDY